MILNEFHNWDINPKHANAIQKKYASKVSTSGNPKNVKYIAGIDLAFADDMGFAAVVVLHFNTLEIKEAVYAHANVNYPYIPGLLSFREIPVIVKALEKLKSEPDILFLDGQGRLHPRRFGIACHLGLMTNIPTIGCAKSLLCGTYRKPRDEKARKAFVKHKGETIGVALRTRSTVNEIFVSVGNNISLANAVKYVLAVSPKYRIPEPTRQADRLAGEYKREVMGGKASDR